MREIITRNDLWRVDFYKVTFHQRFPEQLNDSSLQPEDSLTCGSLSWIFEGGNTCFKTVTVLETKCYKFDHKEHFPFVVTLSNYVIPIFPITYTTDVTLNSHVFISAIIGYQMKDKNLFSPTDR